MENAVVIFLGVVILVAGIIIATGHIELIHKYNRKRITEETRKPYGKAVGSGCSVVGASMVIDGILSLFFETYIFTVLGLAIGLVLIFYGQIKYNKGIF